MPRESKAARSPRTSTRAHLPHSAIGDLSESLVDISVVQDAFSDTQSISTIPVMDASSMEPVVARLPPSVNAPERKHRHRMTDLQLQQLEGLYQTNTHPTRETKDAIAKEIGMSSKSVLIWFQNRRQDRRKKSGKGRATASPKKTQSSSPSKAKPTASKKAAGAVQAANTASGVARTSPSQHSDGSSATSQTHNPIMLRLPALSRSSSLTLASENGNTTGGGRKRTSSSPLSFWLPLPASAGRPHRVHPGTGTDTGDTPPPHTPARALKLSLDWACANSAARRDHGASVYRDEDDSEGEITECEMELAEQGHTRIPLKRLRARNLELENVDVPREYEMVPPDLALGASLLLSLKHSAD